MRLVECFLLAFLCLVVDYVTVVVNIVNVRVVVEWDVMVLTVLLLSEFLQMTTGLVVSIVSTCTAGATCASTVEEMLMGVDLGLGLEWG